MKGTACRRVGAQAAGPGTGLGAAPCQPSPRMWTARHEHSHTCSNLLVPAARGLQDLLALSLCWHWLLPDQTHTAEQGSSRAGVWQKGRGLVWSITEHGCSGWWECLSWDNHVVCTQSCCCLSVASAREKSPGICPDWKEYQCVGMFPSHFPAQVLGVSTQPLKWLV